MSSRHFRTHEHLNSDGEPLHRYCYMYTSDCLGLETWNTESVGGVPRRRKITWNAGHACAAGRSLLRTTCPAAPPPRTQPSCTDQLYSRQPRSTSCSSAIERTSVRKRIPLRHHLRRVNRCDKLFRCDGVLADQVLEAVELLRNRKPDSDHVFDAAHDVAAQAMKATHARLVWDMRSGGRE